MTPVLDERKQRIADQLDAEYAGVGWWGLLYRAPARRRWYRLIPAAELNAVQREDLSNWPKRPRRADLVPVVSEDQTELAGQWFQVVAYESAAERSLAHVLAEDRAADRVACVAGALRALPGWSKTIGPGLTALPGEVVLADGRTLLLPLPAWGPPSLAEVFAEPERLAYLTPEAARGVAGARPPGLHALAVAARSCFETLPAGAAGSLMQRAACAAAFADTLDQRRDGRLPSWLRRVENVEAVRARLRVLTGPAPDAASSTDAVELAGELDAARQAMDPVAAVRALRDAGDPRRAVGLALAALVDRPSYQLLLLAAEIARRDLREPFEALSLLERAVQTVPVRTEAPAEQLSILSALWSSSAERRAGAELEPSFAGRLAATARAAFEALPDSTRRDKAHEMAQCLIGQGSLEEANAFAHRWLYNGRTLMWWQFDLMIDYGETFLLLAQRKRAAAPPDAARWDSLLTTAEQMRDQVKAGLRRVRENQQMSASQIREHGRRLAEFEERLLAARNRRDGS